MQLDDNIQYLKGVGPALAAKLQKLGIGSLRDLLYHFPSGYEDRTSPDNPQQLSSKVGGRILLRGSLVALNLLKLRPKLTLLKAVLRCSSGEEVALRWFNQAYLQDKLSQAAELLISGKVVWEQQSSSYVVQVDDQEPLTSTNADRVLRVVPFYPLTAGLYHKKLRELITLALAEYLVLLQEPLPAKLLQGEKLMTLPKAIAQLHFPDSRKLWQEARHRLIFDEFLYPALAMALRYEALHNKPRGIELQTEGELLKSYLKGLPYNFTSAQKRVWQEIRSDLAASRPMNRLLQGDVGSGKTDLAILSLLCAVQSGYQGVVMAPTEILAEQHFNKIIERTASLGVRVVLLLGRNSAKEKEQLRRQIANHRCDIVIGTQSVIQQNISFAKLGLAIIDEQHRFGVVQRQILKAKGRYSPDLLVMTATPIPRTLSLTIYGDLDKSVIDELPPGRTPIKTYHILPRDRKRLYELCRQELQQSAQLYIVYPLVEESAKIDLKAATESYQLLKDQIFTKFNVALLHGRLKAAEKQQIMAKFSAGEYDILVSTTVIEVGIDVPNATMMIIEHAERFGLAQLHQLRGRVGRGVKPSSCYLVSAAKSQESRQRIKALVESTDGFKLAEIDLKLRGAGDFIGTRQSGMPLLKLADLTKDQQALERATSSAKKLAAADPQLLHPDNKRLRQELFKRVQGLADSLLLD